MRFEIAVPIPDTEGVDSYDYVAVEPEWRRGELVAVIDGHIVALTAAQRSGLEQWDFELGRESND